MISLELEKKMINEKIADLVWVIESVREDFPHNPVLQVLDDLLEGMIAYRQSLEQALSGVKLLGFAGRVV